MDYDHIDKRVGELAAEVHQGFGAVDERIDGLAQEVRRGFAETTDKLRRYMDIVAERLETRFQQTVDGQFAVRGRVSAHDQRLDTADRKLESLDLRLTALEHPPKQ